MARKGDSIPRDDFLYGVSSEVVSQLTFDRDPLTGEFSIREIDPTSLTRRISYVKKSGKDKPIYSAPSDWSSLNSSHFEDLKKRFDYLLAVDTNTLSIDINGYRVSACSIYCIIDPLQSIRNEVPFEHLASYLILDTDSSAKHEPLGWHLTTKHVETPFLKNKRIGFIVDSEFGRHSAINSGAEPYYKEFKLPANVALIYASSDKSEIFANQMIKYCDRAASMILGEFKRRGVEEVIRRATLKIGSATYIQIVGTRDGA